MINQKPLARLLIGQLTTFLTVSLTAHQVVYTFDMVTFRPISDIELK